MRICVAICTWNRCDLLALTLERMAAIAIPQDVELDVLVVDNSCTDATPEVVERWKGGLPLRRVQEPMTGLSNARNRALKEARGEHIIFTDDDVLLDPGWLVAAAATLRAHPSIDVIGGPVEPWFVAAPDPTLAAAFPSLGNGFCGVDHGPEERLLGPEEYVWGANMGFRRASLDGLRFDPELGRSGAALLASEDRDVIDRLRARGGQVRWCPAMRVKHYVDPARMTLGYLTAYYAGLGRSRVRRAGIPEGPRLFGAPRWILRRWMQALAGSVLLRLWSRRAALACLREVHYNGAILSECRALSRRPQPTK